MENQHQKIKGYRDLSQEEIDLMNEIKAIGPQVQAVIEKVQNHIATQRYNCKCVRDSKFTTWMNGSVLRLLPLSVLLQWLRQIFKQA